ncbi:hypothetical protein M0R45_036963 [Rubus argutus]|uniref:Uncharacterized protein n=1 Tax=Rubus argutus TaxID=59490 RepID=A0AAW1W0L7_RUBAR
MVSAIESESIDGGREFEMVPRRQLLELVDCGLGLLDEPIDGLAGPVVSEPVLHVAELNGRWCGEQDVAVSQYFGSADLLWRSLRPVALRVWPRASTTSLVVEDDVLFPNPIVKQWMTTLGGGGCCGSPSSEFA